MNLTRFIQITVGCLRGAAIPFFAAFTLATNSGLALAQPDQTELRTCRGIADNSARLACYDALLPPEQQADDVAVTPPEAQAPVASPRTMGSATTTTPAPAVAAPAQAAATAPAAAASVVASITPENFGAAPPRVETNAEGEAELVATVTAIEELTKGKVRISLSNGQVWKQSISKSFFLRERDAVRISRSPWGGTFRLNKDGKPGYIQVERLR